MLARLVSGRFELRKNKKGEVMISRNPKPFLRALDYLRNNKPRFVYVQDEIEENELRQELDYLCVDLRPGTEFILTKSGKLELKLSEMTVENQ